VPQSQTGIISVTVTSINHFSGTVSVSATLTTSANIPPVVASSQSSVILTPDQTASFSVTILATTSTTLGQYNITVQGKTSTLSRSITVSADVTPPPPPPTPDFYLFSNLSSIMINQGASTSATLTISSILSYSGTVALTATVYPPGVNSPAVSLNLTSLKLPGGGANATTVIVNTFNATVGYYAVLITGTSGSLVHTLSITLSVTPYTGYESLYGESFYVNSPTNATLYIRNLSPATTTLVSYYVTDTSGDMYTLTNWNGPTINPNAVGAAMVLIGASCSRCVLSGLAFTFTAGGTYGITVVTRYNNQFTFTITLSNRESLNLENFAFNSSTSVILDIRNTGTATVQLVSYYVKDSSGNQYALLSYPGPTIAPNQLAQVTVRIGSSCPGCTLTGTPFTFTAGYSYTITFVTSRNNQFTFTVTR